ncbi:MAG TPA: glycoside hydrolase family 9 protein [Verrucomicrobiae bacterium]|nr:glycoside hydrolase family 9 protein [Verrucomicrobiae bacterium]
MRGRAVLIFVLLAGLGCSGFADNLVISDDQPLRMPLVGAHQLRVLSPTLLELTLITTKDPDPATVTQWDFVDVSGQTRLPAPGDFAVTSGDRPVSVSGVGFRRRVLYAPFRHRDLRIGNYLYLQLASAVSDNQTVVVNNPRNDLWPASMRFVIKTDPLRWSPVLHVNQTGYIPAYSKEAMVGYYLGSLGEMDLGHLGAPVFHLFDTQSGKDVFQGPLTARPDQGFPFACYQEVLEADFSAFKTPGEYRLFVAGLGTSFPFRIDEAVAGAFARTYALGIYHQRCGEANAMPFTRFTHGPCHTAPAEVPDMSGKFDEVNAVLANMSADFKDNPRHTAPQLRDVAASLYPFVNRGPVDVSGGHHDAGDYSKYTINSASFIHQLVFAADVFPGVADLDNLGLPESGDGKSDVLEEAKKEADFLAKMQDADGGFYFLVYPRDREYENNVTPDHGDPQVVFPKTTAVTAAASAALAQCASSPTFKREFPEAAAMYLTKAKKGWDFLERAIAKYGKDGSYQKISHYGNDFMHDDELAWAACELFLATGEDKYQQKLLDWLDPSDPGTRKWGWWRLYDAYGCAIRSYAFAAKAGKIKRDQQNVLLLEACEAEIAADGADQLRRAQESAYGTSFPEETKRAESAGWYFSGDAAFDLAVACQLDYPVMNDPRPQMMAAIISNLNYEEGCNPVNVTYLTGLGWKRQREIVDQYAQNSRRVLPPTGIPLGNIQGGFGWLYVYKKELDELSFPSDGSGDQPYPFYDRWGDSFNLSQEFITVNQARSLGYLAWLMAQTPLKKQPWKSANATIIRVPNDKSAFTLSAPGMDLSQARIVWEAEDQEPAYGKTFVLTGGLGRRWIEAEAQFTDGRRVFALTTALVP